MFPTREEALKLIRDGLLFNPGPWGKHCLTAVHCAEKIASACGDMDVEKAYILGLLHDIGRKFGVRHKEMSKSDLRKKAEIAPNTMTKLRRDEEVSLTILSKICKTLHADFGDIVEYVPDAEIWDLYNENRELLGKDHIRGEQLPIDG